MSATLPHPSSTSVPLSSIYFSSFTPTRQIYWLRFLYKLLECFHHREKEKEKEREGRQAERARAVVGVWAWSWTQLRIMLLTRATLCAPRPKELGQHSDSDSDSWDVATTANGWPKLPCHLLLLLLLLLLPLPLTLALPLPLPPWLCPAFNKEQATESNQKAMSAKGGDETQVGCKQEKEKKEEEKGEMKEEKKPTIISGRQGQRERERKRETDTWTWNARKVKTAKY